MQLEGRISSQIAMVSDTQLLPVVLGLYLKYSSGTARDHWPLQVIMIWFRNIGEKATSRKGHDQNLI